MSVRISGVVPDSICAKKGIKPDYKLVSINGNKIADVLDYRFYLTEAVLKLIFEDLKGKPIKLKLKKKQYEDIGLEFETYLMDKQRTCTNNCIFCFVDQMPLNMRKSLYFKDDDARLSFLFGNYITLTNLNESEIERIIKMKISPINISVHTTNPELRCKMMNNRFAGEKLKFIKMLAGTGIAINCQLVMCPGINDGEELKRSLKDLGELYPSLESIACVPVGLTKFRKGLYPLSCYDEKSAGEVIDTVEHFAGIFLEKYGSRICYASDEFYIRANRPIPNEDFYENFAQLENGVGVLALLKSDFFDLFNQLETDGLHRNVSIATGVDAAPFIQKLIDCAAQKWHNLNCRVYAVTNNFFGDTITVAGLVTATDIMAQLKDKPLGDVLILPSCMLNHKQDKFLDDYTVSDVENALGVKIVITDTEGDSLLKTVLEQVND